MFSIILDSLKSSFSSKFKLRIALRNTDFLLSFSIDYLTFPEPTFSHFRGDALNHTVLITARGCSFDTKVIGIFVTRLGLNITLRCNRDQTRNFLIPRSTSLLTELPPYFFLQNVSSSQFSEIQVTFITINSAIKNISVRNIYCSRN